MPSITECDKCTHSKDNKKKIPLTPHAVCDLKPVLGFSGPCALKLDRGEIDHDDGLTDEERKPRKPGKARPNARKRNEDKDKR